MRKHKNSNICEDSLNKRNQAISNSLFLTKEKRKTQECKVITTKIQVNKLSSKQKEALKMLFIEAKWIRNEMIGYGQTNNIFDYLINDQVKVRNKNKEFELRDIKYISSQQIQSVIQEVKDNIKALNKARKKGNKIGGLRFTSSVNSINLKQYNVTFKIKSKTKMKIQGISGDVKVKGLEQLPTNCDIANAKLISRPDGYFIKITIYVNKNEIPISYIPDTSIGIDMGVKNNITLSNGRIYNVSIEETDRLKKLQRKFSRKKKGSNNRYKILSLIKKEYQNISNKKDDIANKIVHSDPAIPPHPFMGGEELL